MSPLRRPARPADVLDGPAPAEEFASGGGKGKPTPKRTAARDQRAKTRKAAPVSRKERSAARRDSMRTARESLSSTDVSRLPARERVPELVFARDLVDSRFYVGQTLIWTMLTVLLLGRVPPIARLIGLVGVAALIVIVVATLLDARRITARVRDRFPNSTTRGMAWYCIRRVCAPRRLRRPVPRVARGADVR